MKRFYCTVCKKVKRTQKFPASVSTPKAENPTNRIGQCNFHSSRKLLGGISRKDAMLLGDR